MFTMEQCFRVALWMFAFAGYLQANPVKREETECFGQGDLGLCDLRQEVTCVNVTFSAPKNTEVKCIPAALECFEAGLKDAMRNCTGQLDRISDTLENLARMSDEVLPLANEAECKLEKQELHFEQFVDALDSFFKNLNSLPAKSKKP